MLGKGNGKFGSPQPWGTGSGSYAVKALAVADLNGDGKPDIVTANHDDFSETTGSHASVSVFFGNGNGTFTFFQTFQTNFAVDNPTSIAVADVNGDGRPDVLVAGYGGGVDVLHNGGTDPTLWFVSSYNTVGFNSAGTPHMIAVGDFNGDNRPDIVVTNGTQVDVLLNLATGGFAAPQVYDVGGAPSALTVGDVNGDGKLDIVTANYEHSVSVLRGNGDGTFAAAQTYAIGGAPNSIVLGDFNNDGKLDIVTAGTELDLLQNRGDGTFAAAQKVGPAGSSVTAADFNNDGLLDLAQIDGSGASVAVFLNQVTGRHR
jgi:hypothetical protein